LAKLPYAYPIYDLTYKENLEVLKRAAKKVRNFQTTGRQGLYRYNNMDHSIAMGRRIAKTILKGAGERADEVAAGEEDFGSNGGGGAVAGKNAERPRKRGGGGDGPGK